MSRIDDDSVHIGLHKCLYTVDSIRCNAHSSSHAKPSFLVFASHRLVLCLRDVFVSDEADEFTCVIKDGKFLYLVLLQNLSSCFEVCLNVGCDQIFASHYILNRSVYILLETEVAIGYNAFQVAFIIHNGNAANMIFRHQLESITNATAQLDGNGVVNHAVLCAFHDGNLSSLLLDTHVFVDDTNATFASNRNSHRSFGDCIHRGCHERNLQFYVSGEQCLELYCAREHFGIAGNQQDVVVGETVHHNLVCNK